MKRLVFFLLAIFFGYVSGQAQSKGSQSELQAFDSLEEAGFNSDSIDALLKLIYDTPPNDFRGLVVIKDGKIALEEYFSTFWRISVLDIRSAGKSITSMLLGVAIQEGLVNSVEQDLYSFFPKSKYPFINEDYKQIKLKDLLNMSSGLDADTDDGNSPGQAGNWMAMDDWKSYVLQIPLVRKPGKQWVYADINALLIGMVIEETSGMSLRDFAKQKLFAPLGIQQVYWYTNAANQTGAAGNLYLSTLDFAKLGMLVVNGGVWDGRQVMDAPYTEALFNGRVEMPEDWVLADTYGMLWYKSSRMFGGKAFEYIYASGNGGNHLVVFPDHNMVIALTSSAYGQRYAHGRSFRIMSKILSAME